MTTASKITLVRVVLIPVFMVLLLLKLGHNIPALIVFIIASCTDFVDGYIARHRNQVSDFGKFLDPLADKLLVISAIGPGIRRDGSPSGGRGGRPRYRGSHERQGQDFLYHGRPLHHNGV